ncbi:MAG: PIN domain-containing protein, partial [Gemmataceae bacterium]|nr:PIN domain-containing protein [Gemmataceae bacterium]
MYLPDVNVWLALAFRAHIHHAAATMWQSRLAANQLCYFCRLTQQGFLRLATNPKAFPTQAVSLLKAWQMYDAILADPRFAFADEPAGLEPIWRGFTQSRQFSPKVWNDAYLAAFAIAGNHEVVTFDQAMTQY